jgi:hypothetical protein
MSQYNKGVRKVKNVLFDHRVADQRTLFYVRMQCDVFINIMLYMFAIQTNIIGDRPQIYCSILNHVEFSNLIHFTYFISSLKLLCAALIKTK